jgi:imidazolonepropionase-like amidohydrolase
MFDVRHAIRKGLLPGPKVYVAGRLVVPTAGHCYDLPGLANEASGPDDFRRAVREEIRNGADFIKIAVRGRDTTQEELNAAVDEGHRRGKKVACHTYLPPAQRMAIDAGVDTFEHGWPTEEEIDLALQKGITWSPTLNYFIEYAKECDEYRKNPDPAIARPADKAYNETIKNLEKTRVSIAYALKAGLRMIVGTDAVGKNVRFANIADEIANMVDYGCTPMQALQATTLWSAQAMGWDEEIGSLQVGKLADVIAVTGDPLADIRVMNQVALVVREGKVIRAGQ